MTELLVRRRSAFQDVARNYAILIDGTEAGTIANDTEARIALTPGVHIVQLKIDWCWSNAVEISVADGGVAVIDCGANGNPFLAILYITIWRHKYLWLKVAKP
ncbi:MAG: hypothetical protein V4631_22435 [Pseudomonadota bacterium]